MELVSWSGEFECEIFTLEIIVIDLLVDFFYFIETRERSPMILLFDDRNSSKIQHKKAKKERGGKARNKKKSRQKLRFEKEENKPTRF